ncbi:MAG: hypothetical protein K2J96_06910, partial [Bacteroidaceae bacterium]|nr:hypothetical protein [Bacteroidaceae bacterium]
SMNGRPSAVNAHSSAVNETDPPRAAEIPFLFYVNFLAVLIFFVSLSSETYTYLYILYIYDV